MANYHLGGDVSKGYCDFVILDENKKIVMANFQLDDTCNGHKKLCQILDKFLSTHSGDFLNAAVESTGGYENNWLNCLLKFAEKRSMKVARLNPLGVNRNSQAELKRNKTDKISAKDVAEYLIAHPNKATYLTLERMLFETVKEQYSYIQLMIKQKVQLVNHLEKNIYKANPELLRYCKNKLPQWVLKLLQYYPTAKHLSAASAESLLELAYVSHKTKATQIIEQAKTSVACNTDETTADRIRDLVAAILKQDKKIDYEKEQLKSNKNIMPKEVGILISFKGIGVYSAIGLLIYIDTIERFAGSKHIASYFGVHPVFRQSGDGKSGIHMSKKGASAVRAILFMSAMSAIVHNPLIKEIYERHLQRGKKKMDAIGICMHKILRIVFGMLKNETEFNADIDRNNQAKYKLVSQNSKPSKDRRHQNFDSDAPISRRQTKKRDEQKSDIIEVKKLTTYKSDLSNIVKNQKN